ALLAALGIDPGDLVRRAEALQGDGKSAVFLAAGGRARGLIAVADRIKPTTAEAIRGLHDAGLRIVMATGDAEATAQAVAATLGIDEVHAGVSPEGKGRLIGDLRGRGGVAMAGDGIND